MAFGDSTGDAEMRTVYSGAFQRHSHETDRTLQIMSEDQEPVVRVRDRRKFNPDGSPRTPDRDDSDDAPRVAEPLAAPSHVAATPETPSAAVAPDETAAGPAEGATDEQPSGPQHDSHGRPRDASVFSDLVVQLATQAAMYLGMVTDPLGPQYPADLRAARQMIDIIAMLKDKTKGNLTPDESVILERILTDLRMKYVSMSSPPRQ